MSIKLWVFGELLGLYLTIICGCAPLVTPPMNLMPAYPAGEEAKQARIAEREKWPGGIRPWPALYETPVLARGDRLVPSGYPGINTIVRAHTPSPGERVWDS